MPQVDHVIQAWLYVRNDKQFIGVSSPRLHVFPGESVKWQSRNGGGEFSIEFDKAADPVDHTPFKEDKTESGQPPLRVLPKPAGANFSYTVYLKEDRRIYLDPTLIVENP